jgi:hypothetical protein
MRHATKTFLANIAPNGDVTRLNESQPEFVRPIWTYMAGAVSQNRIEQGRAAYAARKDALASIVERTGVPVEFAIAIWGVESSFGGNKGSSDVVRSLATLAYTGRRTALGESELLAVFDILERGEATRSDLIGSWAGAMGHTQFMPSSFLSRAIDGDGDGLLITAAKPVLDTDNNTILVVAPNIGRIFEIRGDLEAEHTGAPVNVKKRCISATVETKNFYGAGIRISGGHGGDDLLSFR